MIMLETHLFRNLEQTSVCIHSANMKFHTTNSHLQSINAITITQTKKRHNFRCFPFYILNFIVIIIIIARASYSNELPCHLQHTLETRQRHTLYRLLHHATERAERNSTVLCAAAVCWSWRLEFYFRLLQLKYYLQTKEYVTHANTTDWTFQIQRLVSHFIVNCLLFGSCNVIVMWCDANASQLLHVAAVNSGDVMP